MSAENLRKQWVRTNPPLVFNPNETNYLDLRVGELGPHLVPAMTGIGYNPVGRSDLPKIDPYGPFNARWIYGVPIEQLPESIRHGSGVSLNADEVMDWAVAYRWDGFLDPKDRLFFAGANPDMPTIVRVLHRTYPTSDYWRVSWGLQIDSLYDLRAYPDIKEGMVQRLPPSPSMESQLGRKVEGITIGIDSRSSKTDKETYRPAYIGGFVLSSRFLNVNREGNYPFNPDLKDKVAKGVSDTIRDWAFLSREYASKLLELYRFASDRGGLDLELFGAGEVR